MKRVRQVLVLSLVLSFLSNQMSQGAQTDFTRGFDFRIYTISAQPGYQQQMFDSQSANQMKSIAVDTRSQAENSFLHTKVFYNFKIDLSQLKDSSECVNSFIDLQYQDGNSWKSIFDLEGTDGGGSFAKGWFTYTNCMDVTQNEYPTGKGINFPSNSNARWLPDSVPGTEHICDNISCDFPYTLPNFKPGKYTFRFVNHLTHVDIYGNITDSGASDEILSNFSAEYKTSKEPQKLKIVITYPKIVIFGKRYTAQVKTTPAISGNCTYYLFHFFKIPIASSQLSKGMSKLTFPANWYVDQNSMGGDQYASLSVTCGNNSMSGSQSSLFLGTGHP
jgi:hypothetical protein